MRKYALQYVTSAELLGVCRSLRTSSADVQSQDSPETSQFGKSVVRTTLLASASSSSGVTEDVNPPRCRGNQNSDLWRKFVFGSDE